MKQDLLAGKVDVDGGSDCTSIKYVGKNIFSILVLQVHAVVF
jgi:hypothetical protein